YASRGGIDAACWEAEGEAYGYTPGPSASIDNLTLRCYYSGTLGQDKPGIKIQVKLNGVSSITANIRNHTKFQFTWFPADFERTDTANLNISDRENYQAVHNENNAANIWVGVKGPEQVTVDEQFNFTSYGQLLIGSGLLSYDIKMEEPDGNIVDLESGTALDRFQSSEYTPTKDGEHNADVSAADQSGHGNGTTISTKMPLNATHAVPQPYITITDPAEGTTLYSDHAVTVKVEFGPLGEVKPETLTIEIGNDEVGYDTYSGGQITVGTGTTSHTGQICITDVAKWVGKGPIDIYARVETVDPEIGSVADNSFFIMQPAAATQETKHDTTSAGDPVYLTTGEFYQDSADLTIPGRGFPFKFIRKYRSKSMYNGPLGYGWDFNYNARLIQLSSASPDILF
ncbi:MAG: DUF6531 domain-containing protein, partial [Planctomycetota bacterium]